MQHANQQDQDWQNGGSPVDELQRWLHQEGAALLDKVGPVLLGGALIWVRNSLTTNHTYRKVEERLSALEKQLSRHVEERAEDRKDAQRFREQVLIALMPAHQRQMFERRDD